MFLNRYRSAGLLLTFLLIFSIVIVSVWSAYGNESLKEIVVLESDAENKTAKSIFVEETAAKLAETAKSAILIDGGSGTVLYEKNSHEKLPPASITKIMTMLLTLEAIEQGRISLQDSVTISQRAASMGGSQMYMEQGEQQTVETLLKGMAIGSANDACVAVAEYVAGSEDIFIEMMNKRASELGMSNTHFTNTNGLPAEDHYTSAHDIGLMSKELLKQEAVHQWFTTWQTKVLVGLTSKKQTEFELTNTNRLIKLYPGANGIKTGFTQEAGYCLSGSATKDDLTLIAVVLGCDTTHSRWGETMRLLDFGFATCESVVLAKKGEALGRITIEKGSLEEIDAVSDRDINLLVKKGEREKITTQIVLFDGVKAPLEKGKQVGELIALKDSEEVDKFPLIAAEDVGIAGLGKIYTRMLKTLI